MGFLANLFGNKKTRDMKRIQPWVDSTLAAYEKIKDLDNDSLRHKTIEFKEYIKKQLAEQEAEIERLKASVENNPDMDLEKKNDIYEEVDKLEKKLFDRTDEVLGEIMPEAFAVMKETARRFKENAVVEATATDLDRELASKYDNINIEGDKVRYNNSWMAGGNMITWDMVHYDVQLFGGIVLSGNLKKQDKEQRGYVAEMATGEGKTLVATLPVYLNALAGNGVHVVTVNDYLAKRDSEWMGPLYNFLGLTCDCIDKHEPNSKDRRAAYNADITYGTNNEFGFDYLRDNMTRDYEELVQRKKHYFALVDEVDSVLIDDARTPLIISGPVPHGEDQEFLQLKPDVVRLVEVQKRLVSQCIAQSRRCLTSNSIEDGVAPADQLLRAYRGLPKNTALIKLLSEEGMKTILLNTEGRYMQSQSKEMHFIDNDQTELDDKINEKILDFNEKIAGFNKELDSMSKLEGEKQQKKKEEIGKEAINIGKDFIPLIAKFDEQINDELVKYDDVKFAKTLNDIVICYKNFAYLVKLAGTTPAKTPKPFDEYCKEISERIKSHTAGSAEKQSCIDNMLKLVQEESIAVSDDFRLTELNNVNFGKYGLYFVIDEKLNTVDLTERGLETLSQTYKDPNFFVLPKVEDEINEINKSYLNDEEKDLKISELSREFSEKSERVHTVQQLLKAYTMFEREVDYVVIDNKVKIVDEQTGRIMEGRRWSDGLHQAIEAKENVNVEAATQTYATITLQNYFRLYHKLSGMTGTAITEAGEFWDIYKLDVIEIPTNRPIARIDNNDLIYKTKREKYSAVIDEIEKLVAEGRPVLVGTTSVEVSELLSRMLTRKNIKHNVLNAKRHEQEAQVVREAGRAGTVTIATNMAGRGTDIKLGPGVKEAGGLAIIGTERHESRRVDRQLRGRSGRQGDPGSSQFFVSLEDDLMRIFGSDRIARVMDRLGLQEGEVIQHSMITKQIENAQKKVEENHFGVRKHLVDYDDVMNEQRKAIYEKRRHALFGERVEIDINNMINDLCESFVDKYYDTDDYLHVFLSSHSGVDLSQENDYSADSERKYEGMKLYVLSKIGVKLPFDKDEIEQGKEEEIARQLVDEAMETFNRKINMVSEKVIPIIKDVNEKQPGFRNILIPFTDGKKKINVVVNIEKAIQNGSKEISLALEESVIMKMIDDAWVNHLREIDDMKQAVMNSAHYEQKDPLVIYKIEAFNLFKDMIMKMNSDVVSFLMKSNLPEPDQSNIREHRAQAIDRSKLKEQRTDLLSQAHSNTQENQITQPIRVEKKVGRNDPCPCGSGKKYKNCHGRLE